MGVVNSYRDIPVVLTTAGIIDPKLRETWIRMIGFRNILVHQYADIDHQIVYSVLQNQLPYFAALRKQFSQYL